MGRRDAHGDNVQRKMLKHIFEKVKMFNNGEFVAHYVYARNLGALLTATSRGTQGFVLSAMGIDDISVLVC